MYQAQPSDKSLTKLARKNQAVWNWMAFLEAPAMESWHKIDMTDPKNQDISCLYQASFIDTYKKIQVNFDGLNVGHQLVNLNPSDFRKWLSSKDWKMIYNYIPTECALSVIIKDILVKELNTVLNKVS